MTTTVDAAFDAWFARESERPSQPGYDAAFKAGYQAALTASMPDRFIPALEAEFSDWWDSLDISTIGRNEFTQQLALEAWAECRARYMSAMKIVEDERDALHRQYARLIDTHLDLVGAAGHYLAALEASAREVFGDDYTEGMNLLQEAAGPMGTAIHLAKKALHAALNRAEGRNP